MKDADQLNNKAFAESLVPRTDPREAVPQVVQAYRPLLVIVVQLQWGLNSTT